MRWAAWLLLAALLGARPGFAQEVVADLSDHFIAINTAFTGTDVVLFGTVDAPADIAVVIQGPREDVEVWQRARTLGVWTNSRSVIFEDAPSFYVIATTRPLESFAEPAVLERQGIGIEYLPLTPRDAGDLTAEEAAAFRAALVRNRQQAGVYGVAPGRVAFLGQRLFRTDITFPANLPTGRYDVSVFAFRDGAVVGAQTTPLSVSQVGLSAGIVRFARREAALYGLGAIAMAIAAGWAAGTIFRRS